MKPYVYRPTSSWRSVVAFSVAILVHVSAVAVASHRASPPFQADSSLTTVGFDPKPEVPSPPPVEVPLPSPPPLATTEFVEPLRRRDISKAHPVLPIRTTGRIPLAAVANPKAFALYAPRPEYPYEARSRRITGSGVVVLTVDPSGRVTGAEMEQSIGCDILDQATISTFKRWRFRPGTPPRVRIPIIFLLTGASY
jgi:protein TonB